MLTRYKTMFALGVVLLLMGASAPSSCTDEIATVKAEAAITVDDACAVLAVAQNDIDTGLLAKPSAKVSAALVAGIYTCNHRPTDAATAAAVILADYALVSSTLNK